MLKEKLWTDNHWRIELSPKNWRMKSRFLIEQAINRKLERDEKVFYKDRNSANCILDNLYVVNLKKKIKFYLFNNGTMVVQSMKAWSRSSDFCTQCKSDNKPHHALNMCKTCYYVDYYKPKYRRTPNV